MPMPYKGSCLCGAVEVELNDEPTGGTLCHCVTCQKLHTDRSYNVGTKTHLFKVTKGEDALTEYVDKATDSGDYVHRFFCGTCGSAMYSDPDGIPDTLFVKVGILENAASIKPQAEIYVDTQLPELALDQDQKGIKHFEGFMKKEKDA